MEVLNLNTIVQLFSSLGTGAIFIYLYFRERLESKQCIDKKDGQLTDLNSKMQTLVEYNTRTMVGLEDVIKANTEATKTLTERVTDVLLDRAK